MTGIIQLYYLSTFNHNNWFATNVDDTAIVTIDWRNLNNRTVLNLILRYAQDDRNF